MSNMAGRALLTYDDLSDFPDDGLRRELIAGELIVSPSPNRRHQELVGSLYLFIANHVVAHGGGKVYLAPFDVLFSRHDVVEPDLLFIPDDRLDILTDANVQGVPGLVIEVLSNPRVDRLRKRDLYARSGVPEYWIVDPDADRVEVYRLEAGGYGKPVVLEPDEILTYARLPGLSIDLEALFAE